jgi:hypothetical protein
MLSGREFRLNSQIAFRITAQGHGDTGWLQYAGNVQITEVKVHNFGGGIEGLYTAVDDSSPVGFHEDIVIVIEGVLRCRPEPAALGTATFAEKLLAEFGDLFSHGLRSFLIEVRRVIAMRCGHPRPLNGRDSAGQHLF